MNILRKRQRSFLDPFWFILPQFHGNQNFPKNWALFSAYSPETLEEILGKNNEKDS